MQFWLFAVRKNVRMWVYLSGFGPAYEFGLWVIEHFSIWVLFRLPFELGSVKSDLGNI